VQDLYANSLAYADAQLARLVGSLRRAGAWDSTLVIIAGDHGEAFYEHGFAGHGSRLTQEVLHVPLIVRVPGGVPRIDHRPAQLIDIPPTVLGALGLPAHPAFQGEDLDAARGRGHRMVGRMEGGSSALADTLGRHRVRFALTQTPLLHEVAVLQDGWKLTYDTKHGAVRLFDLVRDPLERHEVGDQNEDKRVTLFQTLGAWWTVQLGYYGHPVDQRLWYAPTLRPRDAAHSADARGGTRGSRPPSSAGTN
jgi:arylsulfatase A-like enzyme